MRSPASFRDPSGFIFRRDGEVLRQVNPVYRPHYDALMQGGLYKSLVKEGLLVEHEEVDQPVHSGDAYKIIRPEQIRFISYPYEWCFSQLRDAALCTLKAQRMALEHDMTLKDATAYNVQFLESRPVLIDTLSFERYEEGKPWIAYRQFCQHFLAPLALMAHTDVRLNQLFRIYIDGVPLDLASSLLPARTKARFSMLTHIHLHSGSQRKHSQAGEKGSMSPLKVSKNGLIGLIDSLTNAIKKLSWQPKGTEWGDYYDFHNYSDQALVRKQELVASFIKKVDGAQACWDLGSNTGVFSRVAAGLGMETMSFDVDPAAVEKNYRECRRAKETHVFPLLLDLTNPSPSLGWAGSERDSLEGRGPVDVVLSLALIHHLAIGNNVPLERVAEFYARISDHLIIEFVPKEDSQVSLMLTTRDDIFDDYNKNGFEDAFSGHFEIVTQEPVGDSVRTLYLMRRKPAAG